MIDKFRVNERELLKIITELIRIESTNPSLVE